MPNTLKKNKPLKFTIEQFREWGKQGGQTSAKKNSKRLKELHRQRAVDKSKIPA